MKPKPTSLPNPCETPAQDAAEKIKVVLTRMNIPLNTAVGDRDLCAWQPVRGIVWVQTRNPNHARRMAKRSDGKLVAWGVAGGYLKTFEFQQSMAWAIRLLNRYTAAETTANAALRHDICPETNLKTGKDGL